jgi:hypothetical protein
MYIAVREMESPRTRTLDLLAGAKNGGLRASQSSARILNADNNKRALAAAAQR